MDGRSLSKVARQLGKSKTLTARWSARWNWVGRANAYDADLDRKARTRFADAHCEARERHARVAQASLAALTTPVRAVLDVMRDPVVLAGICRQARESPEGLLALLGLVARCASAIPAIVNLERLSLGITDESVDGHKEVDFTIADRILVDPVAVELAAALLGRVAGVGVGQGNSAV